MNILLAYDGLLPALHYGGVERVIWGLAKSLKQKGHQITLLAAKGTDCPFAKVLILNPHISLENQIPDHIDIVHCHFPCNQDISKPLISTLHGNPKFGEQLHPNTVFISENHALRHNGNFYILNGLNWQDDYPAPNLSASRGGFHFLGKAAWRIKNLKGAINTISKIKGEKLHVLGGNRLNFKMGFRFTLSPNVKFYGMTGGKTKFEILNKSKGLIFPVLWNEPFGLAIIESLYFGSPVYGTPYGSLPELVNQDVGYLSKSSEELAIIIKQNQFDAHMCHEYARDVFNAEKMCEAYLIAYEKILNNQTLNKSSLGLLKQTHKMDFNFN